LLQVWSAPLSNLTDPEQHLSFDAVSDASFSTNGSTSDFTNGSGRRQPGEPDDSPALVPGSTPKGQVDRHRTDKEAERLCLAVLIRGGGFSEDTDSGILGDLSSEMFEHYEELAAEVLRLRRAGAEPDLETLYSEGADVPNEVVDASPPIINAEHFAERVRAAYLSREYGSAFAKLAKRAWEGEDPGVLAGDLLTRTSKRSPSRSVGARARSRSAPLGTTSTT
jgi:hypothetical protein